MHFYNYWKHEFTIVYRLQRSSIRDKIIIRFVRHYSAFQKTEPAVQSCIEARASYLDVYGRTCTLLCKQCCVNPRQEMNRPIENNLQQQPNTESRKDDTRLAKSATLKYLKCSQCSYLVRNPLPFAVSYFKNNYVIVAVNSTGRRTCG